MRANLLAAEADIDGGEVFDIGSGERHTILELIASLETIFDKRLRVVFGPHRPGDVQESLADISRAVARLSYTVDVSLEEGLRRTVEAMAISLAP